MIGFFDTDENEYYFLFILFVSYVRYIYICLGVGSPYWSGIFSSPLCLVVAIGLELRIACDICFDWPSAQWKCLLTFVYANFVC